MTLESLDNDLFTPTSTEAPAIGASLIRGPNLTFVWVVRDGIAVCESDFE